MPETIIMPKADEAEGAILASALVYPATIPQIALLVSPEDFYHSDHQKIMQGIYDLLANDRPIGVSEILGVLEDKGQLQNGIASYLGKLMDKAVAVDIPGTAARIKRASVRRQIIVGANQIIQNAQSLSVFADVRTATTEAIRKIHLALDESSPNMNPWADPIDLQSLLDTAPTPLSWLFDNRIPLGRAMLLCGIGGSSKTRLLYHLGVGCVLGRLSWDWTVNYTGRAVLVLTEDTAEETHRTVYNVCEGLGLTREERQRVYDGLVCYPMAGKNCRLIEKDSTGAMVETALFHSFEKKIIEMSDVVLIGLDPALSITTGDELDQGHQRALGRTVDNLAVRTGATVCLISHAAKNSLNREELDSHNSRGGGAITDAVRAEYSMRTMTAKEAQQAGIDDVEERKRHVQLVATKGNSLPPAAFVPIWLRRDDTGTLSQAEIVFETASRGPGKRDLAALEILRALSIDTTPTLNEWRSECVNRGFIGGPTPEAQSKAMQRIAKKLSDAGLIHRGVGKGVWLPGGAE